MSPSVCQICPKKANYVTDRFKDSADSAAIESPVFFFEVPVVFWPRASEFSERRPSSSRTGEMFVCIDFGLTARFHGSARNILVPVFATERYSSAANMVSDDPTVLDSSGKNQVGDR